MSRPAKTAAKKAAETPAAPEAVVYCGPTIKGVARQFTAYNNGLPVTLQGLVDKYPLLKNLIVPVEQFAEFKKELNTPDSAVNIIFKKSISTIKGGK